MRHDVWCSRCRSFHDAEVVERDEMGWPRSVRWLEPHTAPEPLDPAAIDGLVRSVGPVLAIAADSRQFDIAEEALDAALSLNDP